MHYRKFSLPFLMCVFSVVFLATMAVAGCWGGQNSTPSIKNVYILSDQSMLKGLLQMPVQVLSRIQKVERVRVSSTDCWSVLMVCMDTMVVQVPVHVSAAADKNPAGRGFYFLDPAAGRMLGPSYARLAGRIPGNYGHRGLGNLFFFRQGNYP